MSLQLPAIDYAKFAQNPGKYLLYLVDEQVQMEPKGLGIQYFVWNALGSTRYNLKKVVEKIPGEVYANNSELKEILKKKIDSYNDRSGTVWHPLREKITSVSYRATGVLPSVAAQPITQLKKIQSINIQEFRSINSSQLQETPVKKIVGSSNDRQRFLDDKTYKTPPPVISKSEFVPDHFVEHLMRDKKDSAIGIKYVPGDKITNMEGALHTFVTPICAIKMSGDYFHTGSYHTAHSLDGKVRPVVLSAAIHPDFDRHEEERQVVMPVVELQKDAVMGNPLPNDFKPFSEGGNFEKHERQLLEHMVYHLTRDHKLPSKQDVTIYKATQGLELLEGLIGQKDKDIAAELQNKAIKLNGHVISLEALFTIYLHQIRNEFSALEALLPQGYIYTINPPSFFAQQVGLDNVDILNRLQLLAFQQLKPESFKNLKCIGFDNFKDKRAITFYKKVFISTKVQVIPKSDLQGKDHKYNCTDPYALVIHNNSDGFGQNIETEGSGGSLDGAIGSFSDAACCLNRYRTDLINQLF